MEYLRSLSSSLFLCAALTGCTSTSASAVKAPETTYNDIHEQFSAETIKDIYSYAVKIRISSAAKIEGSDKSEISMKSFVGTGMSLPDNYVLTAAHVLPPPTTKYETLEVTNSILVGDYTAKVIKVDPLKELALLQAENCPKKGCFDSYFAGKIATAAHIGEVIATAGYPANEKIFSKGFVSGRTRDKDREYIIIDNGSATKGGSGSPIFLFQGGKPLLGAVLVGLIADETLINIHRVLVTPVEDVREFLAGVKGLEQLLD